MGNRDRRIDFQDENDLVMTHSLAYHRFFEGYEERREFNPQKGVSVIKRIYVGEWYKRAVIDRRWQVERILYLILYLISCLAFYWGGTRIVVSASKYLFLPTPVVLLALILLLPALIEHLLNPRKMTIGQFRAGAVRVRRYSFIGGLSMLLQAILASFDMAFSLRNLIAICSLLLASILMLFIFYNEKSVSYEKINNDLSSEQGPFIIK